MAKSFAHLHTHSELSLLDGLAHISDLARLAADDGQPALGLTDHGNLYGAIELVDACEAVGIKPVVGMEAYLSPEGSGLAVPVTGKDRYHLILLAAGPDGFANLSKLSSRAFLEGFDSKPCVDMAMLGEHSAGLIATTACVGGIVPQCLLAGDAEGAAAWAGALADMFGTGSFYAEIQDHGIPDEEKAGRLLVEMADRMRIPLLATNDSHYSRPGDADAHDALLCVQTKARMADTERFRFEGAGYWLKSAAEMREMFAERPDAADNTLAIAERVETALPFSVPRLPKVAGEDGAPEHVRLRVQAWAGVKRRYGDRLTAAVAERVRYELGVIESMGYAGYFLVVADLIDHAREVGVAVGPGRGSSAGSIVAYCLGITDLDPLRYRLSFERFLNPNRKSMPDIDMDFEDAGRDEMIAYAEARYGKGCVAQIATFDTIHARRAVRDAAKVLGHPYALGDKISKALPPLRMGRSTPLAACLTETAGHEEGWRDAAALRDVVEADPAAREVVELARRIEGTKRSVGMHAGGVIISEAPLADVVPLQRQPGGTEGLPVVQFDLHGVERFGLVKFDFLGLRTLGVLRRAVELVRSSEAECPDYDKIPLEDPAAYEMMRTGRTTGVFQLESPPMQALMRELRPDRFEDVIALVALYRPGPMAAGMHHEYARRKNGISTPSAPHPDMLEIFADTYGLCVFQEQLVALVQHYAGMSPGDADDVRRACSKKNRDLIAAQRDKFIDGCEAVGRPKELAVTLWDLIPPFADYAFPRAHAACYAALSVRAAWLKTHHPAAFWAAQLTSVTGDYDDMAHYLHEARSEGVAVAGPDVNASAVDFGVEGAGRAKTVRFGLRAVRGLGAETAAAIAEARNASGPVGSLEELCRRLGLAAKRDSVAALVDAGACDAIGGRAELAGRVESACGLGRQAGRDRESGQESLFDGADFVPADDGADQAIGDGDVVAELEAERRALGVYLSGHPLAAWEETMAAAGIAEAGAIGRKEAPGGTNARVYGIVRDLTVRHSANGRDFGRGVLEGTTGRVRMICFGDVAAVAGACADEAVTVRGRVEDDDGDAQLVGFEIEALGELPASGRGTTDGGDGGDAPDARCDVVEVVEVVEVDLGAVVGDDVVARLKTAIVSSPGPAGVIAVLADGRRFHLGEAARVDPNEAARRLGEAGFTVRVAKRTAVTTSGVAAP